MPIIEPLVTGTEDTVVFADKMDQDGELEVVFLRCGLPGDEMDFERYMTEDMVAKTIYHLRDVLKKYRNEKIAALNKNVSEIQARQRNQGTR